MSNTANTTVKSRRQTMQRRAIIGALESAGGPLTPQEILERASSEHAGLGLATVYRNLNLLQAEGTVSTVHLPGEPARFEPAAGSHGHHHHFRCDHCSGVFALDQACPVEVLEGVMLPGGFRVQGHSLTFYGVCPACQPDVR